jgi:hypothetical protein
VHHPTATMARIGEHPQPAEVHVMLINIDEELGSSVIRLTPANAAKLGHRLIVAAESVELP